MRRAGAILNLMMAGVFLLLAARWMEEGAVGWAAFGGMAVVINIVLAVWKFRDAKAPPASDEDGRDPGRDP